MSARVMVAAAALLAGSAVAAGAFGAHGLADSLAASGQTGTFETAVRYQMWHALALLLCGALRRGGLPCSGAAWCFAIGSTIFSGTLYVLALTGITWLGAVTPAGGVLMICGWIALAAAALRGA